MRKNITYGSVEHFGAELSDVPGRLKRHTNVEITSQIFQLRPIRLQSHNNR